MAAGFLRSAAHLEIRDISKLGDVGYPYYQTPRAMGTARQAFALLAVICVAMTGLSAWLAFRRPVTILLTPVILLASPLFFRHSWTYLNVDIVGTSFVMLTLGACLLFAFADAAQARLQGTPLPLVGVVPVQLIQALPYLLTVLLLAGFVGRAVAPRAIGVPYVKER